MIYMLDMNICSFIIREKPLSVKERLKTVSRGKLRASMEKRGMITGAYDLQIAAHALSLNVILVTNNTKEFSKIENLRVEDWTR